MEYFIFLILSLIIQITPNKYLDLLDEKINKIEEKIKIIKNKINNLKNK